MVGQGVLRECLLDSGVELVTTVGRTATGVQHAKVREVVHSDLWNYASIDTNLSGFDACFFCLGISAAGMKEADYARITYGITLAAAETLSGLNPQMTFIYVSGAGTDSTGRGRVVALALQSRIHVSAGRDSTSTRNTLQDGGVSGGIHAHDASSARASLGSSQFHSEHRANRPRHARGGQERGAEADLGKQGYPIGCSCLRGQIEAR